MSFSNYDDFDKPIQDALNDDFDSKFSLKVKSEAPFGVGLTTTTDYCPGAAAFPTKISGKWAHSSGFSVDKLEVAGGGKAKIETSVGDLPFAPGLGFEFKGNTDKTGTLGVEYKHKLATICADLDVAGFSTLNASVLGGAGGVTAGGSAQFALGSKFEVADFSAGLGWAPRDGIFVGLQANNKGTELRSALQYRVRPDLSLAAQVDYIPKSAAHSETVGLSYKCNPNTNLKLKVDGAGAISASVKQNLPNNLSVVGVAAVEVKRPEAFSLGISATLG